MKFQFSSFAFSQFYGIFIQEKLMLSLTDHKCYDNYE